MGRIYTWEGGHMEGHEDRGIWGWDRRGKEMGKG